MAVEVIRSRLGQTGYVERDGIVVEIRDTYLVTGLTAGGSGTHNQEQDALNTAGVPGPGDAYTGDSPNIVGLVCTTRQARALTPTIVEVECIYRIPSLDHGIAPIVGVTDLMDAQSFSGTTFLTNYPTQLDVTGAPITVAHNGIAQGAEVSASRPRAEIGWSATLLTNDPLSYVYNFVGFVNSGDFVYVGDTRMWLCTGIDFNMVQRSMQAGTTTSWHFDFRMAYDPRTWDADVWYTDPMTGKPPADLVSGTGYKQVQIYPEANFAALLGTLPTN
jgi:hypothetical protein